MENEKICCSLYEKYFDKQNTINKVDELLSRVQSGQGLEKIIKALRIETDKEKKKKIKLELPAVTFGGSFESSRTSKLIKASTLITLDFDHVINLFDVKKNISNLPFIYALFTSPSGDGLKVLVKSTVTDGSVYKNNAKQLFKYFEENLSIGADTSKQNINDLCFLSYDPDLYINEDAIDWISPPVQSNQQNKEVLPIKKINNTSKIEAIVIEIEAQEIDITEVYNNWLEIGFALGHGLGEEGRSFYHRISKFNPNYDEDKCNKQFANCLNSNRQGITIATFFHHAELHGLIPAKNNILKKISFFDANNNNSGYYVNLAELFDFLNDQGFRKISNKEQQSFSIVNINNKVISVILKDALIECCMNHIKGLSTTIENKKLIRNAFYKITYIFNENNLYTLQEEKLQMVEDTKLEAFFFFKNQFCKITNGGITTHPYNELKGHIWDYKIINKDFILDRNSYCEYFTFLSDICSSDDPKKTDKRINSIITVIGYLLHGYKNPALVKAIVLMDGNEDSEPNGGKGKGIFIKALSFLINTAFEDGKNIKANSEFINSQITHETKLMVIDDIKPSFKFENLFSILSEGITVNAKYKSKYFIPYSESPKILISTNYVIAGEGESFERRKLEFEFSDHYSQTNTPENKFGHLLFNDWDTKEWNNFFNLMLDCVSVYLEVGLIEPDKINVNIKKLRALAGDQFIQFIGTKLLGKKYLKLDVLNDYKELVHLPHLTQRTFTSWLRIYARSFNLILEEPKSDSKYYFILEKSHS